MKKVIRILFYVLVSPFVILGLPLLFVTWVDDYAFDRKMNLGMAFILSVMLTGAWLFGIVYGLMLLVC